MKKRTKERKGKTRTNKYKKLGNDGKVIHIFQWIVDKQKVVKFNVDNFQGGKVENLICNIRVIHHKKEKQILIAQDLIQYFPIKTYGGKRFEKDHVDQGGEK